MTLALKEEKNWDAAGIRCENQFATIFYDAHCVRRGTPVRVIRYLCSTTLSDFFISMRTRANVISVDAP